MQVDYLIIGQGICGTLLSWFLHKEGKSFIVIDNNKEQTSSRVAAGMINPVTGRRYVYSWMIDEMMPFAWQTYQELGRYFDQTLIFEKSIIDFFPTAQMRNAFVERITENDTYLHSYPDQNLFNTQFNYDFGCGEIKPAYIVQVQVLLDLWWKKLSEWEAIRTEEFNIQELEVREDSIQYGDITAQKIIFCNGFEAASNPWFQLLPFAANKGEVLFIECEGLNDQHVFKRGLSIAPLALPHTFWVGSNYQWEFKDDQPSEAFYNHVVSVLNGWLKMPYKVLAHKAALRPATLERRPFVGFHPLSPNIGILNGMGTKGTSLAPFFANQLVQHLVYGFPITDEADIKRFSRILSR